MGFNFNGSDMDDIYFNGTKMEKVYFNGTLKFEEHVDIGCSPNSISVIESSPYTTAEITCDKAGDIYVEDSNGPNPEYQIEWYKNGTGQGYLIAWNGSSYDLGPDTITVAAGDKIKFRVTVVGAFAGWRMRDTDPSGNIIFSGYVEKV